MATLLLGQGRVVQRDVPSFGDRVNLADFVGWGGRGWVRMVRRALEFLGTDLSGKQVLELGPREGKMMSLFAILGGMVTGLDVRDQGEAARTEARKWGVEDRITYLTYDGDLSRLPVHRYDVIFSKSVLVVVPSLAMFLDGLSARLKPGGKFAFIENGYGNPAVHALRNLRHRSWDFGSANYFGDRQIQMVRQVLNVRQVATNWLPPIVLLCGSGRAPGPVGHFPES